MAFDSAGAGFARGFAGGASIALKKQQLDQFKTQLEQENAQKKHDQFLESVEAQEARADEKLEADIELLTKMAPRFADDDENFQTVRRGAEATIMSIAAFRQQNREQARAFGVPQEIVDQMPNPNEFAEPRIQRLEAQIANAREASQQNGFELVGPEELGEVGASFPEGAILQRNRDTSEVKLLFDPTDDPSSIESRRRMFIEAGASPEQASGLAAGRFELILDPVTREGRVFDKITQQFVGELEATEPSPTADPVIPPGTETSAATGLGGAFRNAVNIVTDAVGAGVVGEKTQEATDAMNLVQVTTKLALQVAIPGRPAKDIRDDLKRLTVTPNSLLQGEDRAKSKLEQMLRFIDNNIAEKQAAIDAGGLKPADISLLQNNVRELNQMKEAHEDLLEGFGDQQDLEVSDEVEAAVKRALGEDD